MSKLLEKWNQKYVQDGFVFGTEPTDFLKDNAVVLKSCHEIFVPGDGEGRNGVWLAQQGFQVLSLDGAQSGVQKAAKMAQDNGICDKMTPVCADLLTWDWPRDRFDAVVNLHLHFPSVERIDVHRNMDKCLKAGGIVLLEVFHPDNVGRDCGGPQDRDLCYCIADLKQDFAGYQVLFADECEKEIMPTPYRRGGRGMVTRFIAQKPG